MENSSSGAQAEFEQKMSKVGETSCWFTFMFFLMVFPTFSAMLLVNFLPASELKVTCKIQELLDANWTSEQIKNVSQPPGIENKCKCYGYNYLKFAEMGYEKVQDFIRKADRLPEITWCKGYVTEGNTYLKTLSEEFEITCGGKFYVIMDASLHLICCTFVGIIFCPLGDIWGRKRLLKWGSDFIFMGSIVTCFSVSDTMLYFGYFLIYSGYAMMQTSIQSLLVEITQSRLRGTLFCLLFIGHGFAQIIFAIMAFKSKLYWRFCQLFLSIGVLPLPLVTWYLPESPRWFMSRKVKSKAWSTLKTIKNAPEHNDMLFLFRNDDINYKTMIKEHYKELKKFLGTRRFLKLTILYVAVSILTIHQSQTNLMDFGNLRYSYQVTSGILKVLSCFLPLPMLYLCGTQITIVTFIIFTGLFYFASCLTKLGTFNNVMALLGSDIFSNSVLIVSSLHVIEMVPTSHRCTLSGLIMLSFSSVVRICIVFPVVYISKVIPFCVMGFYAQVVACVVFLTIEVPKENLPTN